jgi:hypothetical protein
MTHNAQYYPLEGKMFLTKTQAQLQSYSSYFMTELH